MPDRLHQGQVSGRKSVGRKLSAIVMAFEDHTEGCLDIVKLSGIRSRNYRLLKGIARLAMIFLAEESCRGQ